VDGGAIDAGDGGALDGAVLDGGADDSGLDAPTAADTGDDASLPDVGVPDAPADAPLPTADVGVGMLRFLDVSATRTRITEGESVTVNVVITHDDGPSAILGGVVATEAGTTLVSFTAMAPGNFTATFDWAAIHLAEPIAFEAPEGRSFVVRFFDVRGSSATRTVALELHCDGDVACDGQCVDLDSDAAHCGSCGTSCARDGRITGCSSGRCATIERTETRNSCRAICEARGFGCADLCEFTTRCSGSGCSGPDGSYYRDAANFSTFTAGDEAGFFSYYALLSSSGNNWYTTDTASCDVVPSAEVSFYDYDVSVCCCELEPSGLPPEPFLTAVRPVLAHGTSVTIDGFHLADASAVTFGGVAVPFVASATTIEIASLPDAVPVGAQPVVVTTPAGTSNTLTTTVIHLVIAEVDSDTSGSVETDELVELDTGVPGLFIVGYVLVLYNGSTGTAAEAFDVSGTTRADGRLVVGSLPGADVSIGDGLIQNGPDALALYRGFSVDFPMGTPRRPAAIDAVVWDTADPDNAALLTLYGAAERAVQIDESANGAPATDSVQRCGSARLDGRVWRTAPATPGAANACP
jgi:hypothetical protein